MGGASFVHEDFNLRMLTHQRTGRSRVIEMNMRQQNRPDVSHGGAVASQRPAKGCYTRRGPRINQGHPAGAPQHGSGNDAGVSLKQKIGERDAAGNSVHSVLSPLSRLSYPHSLDLDVDEAAPYAEGGAAYLRDV